MGKTISKIAVLLLVVGMMSSCYSTRTYHGATTEKTPMMEVNSKTNHILLWGLLPLGSAKQEVKEFVGDNSNYQVRSQQTFVDGLLGFLTLGIYSPTTTTYYLPLQR